MYFGGYYFSPDQCASLIVPTAFVLAFVLAVAVFDTTTRAIKGPRK